MVTTRRDAAVLAWIVAVLLVAGCAKDPAVAKQEHLKRGNAYADGRKYFEATVEYQSALKIDPKYAEAEIALGEAFLQLGDRRSALRSYVRAADLLPDNVDVQLKAGTMRLFARQYADAQSLADKLLAREPKNIVALILRANALAGLMQVDQAIKEIQEAIQLEPGRAELYANLGSIQAGSGKVRDAEAAFQKAVSLDPRSPKAQAALGNFYWSIKQPKDAERAFLKAVELEPSDVLSNRILATFYLASGRPLDAEKYLKAVANLSGDVDDSLKLADFYLLHAKRDDAMSILTALAAGREAYGPATTRLAAAAYAGGQLQEAHRLLDAVLAQNANDARALLLSARFLALENKSDEALARVQQAIQADPQMAATHYFLGRLYQDRGDLQQATREFQTVLQLNPRAAAAQYQLSRLSLAEGKAGAAVTFADAAAANAAGDPAIHLALVRALLESGDLKRAEVELNQLRRDYPDAAPVLSLAGNLNLRKRDYAAARRSFEEAYKRDPSSIDTMSGLVGLDLAAGRPGDARVRVEAEVKKTPQRADLLLLAARTYAASGDLVKAEQALKQSITVDPSNLDSYAMLGQLYYQQGRLEDGRQEFEKLAQQQPKDVGAQTMLGIILNRQGRTDEAIRQYERLLKLEPQAGVAANNLAWIYAERKTDLDRALELGNAAKRALPDEPSVADTLGWVYYQKDLPWMALPFLRECAEKNPQSPVFHYHLGAAYLRAKDVPKAKVELERALNISATFSGADDARKMLETIRTK
jgi:tetratricopeptide (TPR) repeat protein